MPLAHPFIFLPSFRSGLAGRFFQRRRLFKAHGQSATTGVAPPMQRHKQRSLQKAQAAHQVDMKGRREGIAMVARLGDGEAGLAQAGVVDRHAHQAARTIGQGAPPHARKQRLRFPATTRVEKVLAAPTALLATLGPDDARQTAPAHADQRAQGLTHGALERALLGETGGPVGHNLRPGGEEGHRASGRKPKVFLPVRRKRSPRATFLVREETRLSRSTVTWKVEWRRARSSETCKGARAFLSMSNAMSTWDRPARRWGGASAGEPLRRRRTARSWASSEASNIDRMEYLRSSGMATS